MEIQDFIILSVSFFGLISATKTTFSFIKWVYVMFLRPPKNLKETYGSWAIITGCTDGIGKFLSFELASKGLNLLLVGRNPSKLEATTKEIKEKYGDIEVKTVEIDLAECGSDELATKMEGEMEGLDVGILINNAGLAYPYSRYLHEVDLELMNSVINVNVEAATWITRSVICAMLKKNEKKKKGAIVNIGSGSSVVVPSFPFNSIYASTKAYLAMFSKSIHLEYKHQGIDIQCQIPLFVATKMTRFRKSNMIVASTEKYAKESIRCIGYDQICIPIFSHSVQCFLLKLLPDSLIDWCQFRFYLGLRNKALAKAQNQRKVL
ncbi:very-long-chain 3-oxoacyl-CoA reductase 1-like [Euphorbia lathyris]|uniref:very-long-chain 3-oxoacyl-CoA reductase 1-like n=1 Tax=Euphorbia lathyris TaxID=212925 RepID=UPI003313DCBD